MKILVIGGTRFMGIHLVNALLSAGHDVTIATRGIAADPFGTRVKRMVFQRTDERSVEKTFEGLYFDLVYDSLAYCSEHLRILLDHLSCDRYITVSTTAVYNKHPNTVESDFDALAEPVVWCDRSVYSYADAKRHMERALAQCYSDVKSVAVRFPFVIGDDDYTGRLYFYVEHIIRQKPMDINNYENRMAFVRSDEAGKFLAFFADSPFCGAINGASGGAISIKEIAEYVEKKTGKTPLLQSNGDPAPYNGENEYTINTDLASSIGFSFTPLQEWIYGLLDRYIAEAEATLSK